MKLSRSYMGDLLKSVLILMFVLILAAAMTGTALAENWSFKGSCSYDGEDINSEFDSNSMAASVANMEPGDYLDYEVTYTNDSDHTTEWYMRNSVLETLEENKSQAENGGYTYVLTNVSPDGTETALFDNSVGGENEDVDLEGLLQATNATGEYFYIQKLEPGESAKTRLHVEFDGETEVNDYMDTYGKLMLSYAVEEIVGDKRIVRVKTGDETNLFPIIAVNVAAVVLLIIALVGWKKNKKEERS